MEALLLPQDKAAEQLVIGPAMISAEAASKLVENLTAEDFYVPGHRVIYATILKLVHDPKAAIEAATVVLALQEAGELDKAGGDSYIEEILTGTPGPSWNAYAAERVRRCSQGRQVLAAIAAASAEIREPDTDPEDVANGLQVELHRICSRRHSRSAVRLSAAVDGVLATAERVQAGTVEPGIPYGLAGVDALTGGMEAGQLIVLAAGTSKGKSALALEMAERTGLHGPVLFVSREMTAAALAKRSLQGRTGISGQNIRYAKRLGTGDWQQLQEAAAEIESVLVWIDTYSRTVGEIASRARLLAASSARPVRLVAVDYLQLLDWQTNRGDSKATAIGRIAWGCKTLALDLDVPVLALSQFNRDPNRQNRPPELSDLRDSGEIEQHADVVILLHRPEDVVTDVSGCLEVWARVAKCRDGMTNTWTGPDAIRLAFHIGRVRFLASEQASYE